MKFVQKHAASIILLIVIIGLVASFLGPLGSILDEWGVLDWGDDLIKKLDSETSPQIQNFRQVWLRGQIE